MVGGRSRRLGRDKARLLLAGRPLAHWVMDAVSPLVDEYWLISNQPLEHLSLGFPLLIDVVPGRGALGGLLSVMLVTRGSHVLLSACDTPFLQPALLAGNDHPGPSRRPGRGGMPLQPGLGTLAGGVQLPVAPAIAGSSSG